MVAARIEMEAPMYSDLQTVQSTDGRSRFQAIAVSASTGGRLSCIPSFSSGKDASFNRTLEPLGGR